MMTMQAINVHVDRQNNATIEAVQGDSACGVSFRLFKGGKALEVKTGATATVRYSICHEGEYFTTSYDTLDDGTPAYLFSGSTMTVYLKPEIFRHVGVGELQVGLVYSGDVYTLSSVLVRVQRDLSAAGTPL